MENKIKHLYCKHPCKNCPFRKDTLKNWLPNRIESDLNSDSFVCHKKPSKQCAGHMLLMKNENIFFTLAELQKIDLELKGEELIFETKIDCIKHHKDYEKA